MSITYTNEKNNKIEIFMNPKKILDRGVKKE